MLQHQISPSMEKPILSGSLLQPLFLTTHHNLTCLPCPVFPCFQIKNCYNKQAEPRSSRSISSTSRPCYNKQAEPRSSSSISSTSRLLLSSCHGREPIDTPNPKKKEDGEKQGKQKQSLLWFLVEFEKQGKNLKESLSPKQKGDWKDLMLMSISFAVYVYISQKLVCAYCAWTSIPNQTW